MCDPNTPIDQTHVTRIIEGALLASPEPLTRSQLRALFDDEAIFLAPDSIEQALSHLGLASADRGISLVEVSSGFRFQIPADIYPWVKKLWNARKTKYSRATLETLALIAYRQPITRGEIEKVRGVAVSSQIIQLLEEREWIRVVGHRDVPGRPALLGTTQAFLDYFGLQSLDALPPLSELTQIAALEPVLSMPPPTSDQHQAPLPDLGQQPDSAAAARNTHTDHPSTAFCASPATCDEVTERIAQIGSHCLESDSATTCDQTTPQQPSPSSEAISPMPDSTHDHASPSTPSAARSLDDE